MINVIIITIRSQWSFNGMQRLVVSGQGPWKLCKKKHDWPVTPLSGAAAAAAATRAAAASCRAVNSGAAATATSAAADGRSDGAPLQQRRIASRMQQGYSRSWHHSGVNTLQSSTYLNDPSALFDDSSLSTRYTRHLYACEKSLLLRSKFSPTSLPPLNDGHSTLLIPPITRRKCQWSETN